MPSVLFICSANVCRSPMASAIFQNILVSKSVAGEWRVESAGVWGMDGSPAAQGCQRALRKWDLDVSSHRARTVTRELLESFDLILTMEKGHKEALQWEFPALSKHIYTLYDMIGSTNDVRDPIGGSLADFEDTAVELTHLLEDGFEQIMSLALNSE